MFASGPAQFLGVVYSIVTVLLFVGLIIRSKQQSFKWTEFLSLLLLVALYILIIYDTDCLTVGGCTTWGLVRAIFYSIIPVVMTVMIFYGYMNQLDNRPKKEETEEFH